MFRHRVWLCAVLLVCTTISAFPQQPASAASAVVPTLVNFSGILTDVSGKPLTGMVGVTFSLYKDAQVGAPLWVETQNVPADKSGHQPARAIQEVVLFPRPPPVRRGYDTRLTRSSIC